ALQQQLSSTTAAEDVRAACAWSLGWQHDATAVPVLVAQLARSGEPVRLASWALGQIGDPKTLGPLLAAYFERDRHVVDELVFAIARANGAPPAPQPAFPDGYPRRLGKYDLQRGLASLPGPIVKPVMPPALLGHAPEIATAIQNELASPNADIVREVLADLDSAPDALSLGPITPASPDPTAMAAIAKAIEPRILALVTATELAHRVRALSVLAKIDVDAKRTDAAIAGALKDPATAVREAAAAAVATLARRRGRASP